MKLELGKFEINDVQFAEKSYIENHVLYVNKAEVEALVLEDDKLIECRLDIARPGERTRITPVKDVIEPRVKVSGGTVGAAVRKDCPSVLFSMPWESICCCTWVIRRMF